MAVSPLSFLPTLAEEEEPQNGGGEMMERSRKPAEDRGRGVSAFTTLGTLVLTARPYEPVGRTTKQCHSDDLSGCVDGHGAALQGEIFQTVDKEV